jgi:hypothetical protein
MSIDSSVFDAAHSLLTHQTAAADSARYHRYPALLPHQQTRSDAPTSPAQLIAQNLPPPQQHLLVDMTVHAKHPSFLAEPRASLCCQKENWAGQSLC